MSQYQPGILAAPVPLQARHLFLPWTPWPLYLLR